MQRQRAAGAVRPVADNGRRHVGDADGAEFALGVAVGMGLWLPFASGLGEADLAAETVGIGHQQAAGGAVDFDRQVGLLLPIETPGGGNYRTPDEFRGAGEGGGGPPPESPGL